MRPAVPFPGKHETVAGGPQHLVGGAHFTENAAGAFPRLPHLAAFGGGDVGNANRPGLVGAARTINALAAVAGFTDKGNRPSVGRPRGLAIEVGGGVEITK